MNQSSDGSGPTASKDDLAEYLWASSRLYEVLIALARESGFGVVPAEICVSSSDPEFAARNLRLEALPAEILYGDFERLISQKAPALLRVRSHGADGWIALLPHSIVLKMDLRKVRLEPIQLRSMMCAHLEASGAARINEILELAKVPIAKRRRAFEALLAARFNDIPIRDIWSIRLPPSASFWTQLHQSRVFQWIGILAGAHALQYLLWILAWLVVGSSVLTRPSGRRWLVEWAVLLLALVPLRVVVTWLQGVIAIGVGTNLKQRLFFGALRLDPDVMRREGIGHLLGRVIESEAVETLALSGGFLGLVSMIELVVAIFVLAAGTGGVRLSAMLLTWLTFTGLLAWRYFTQSHSWANIRLAMTHDLVENMVGHRTRLVQLPKDQWHVEEDATLERYLHASQDLDRSSAMFLSLVPRGWLVLGLMGVAWTGLENIGTPVQLAVAVGGMLLAYRALKRLTAGAWQLAGAAVAWDQVSPLFQAAKRLEPIGSATPARPAGLPVLETRDLAFSYLDGRGSVLSACSLRIHSGDRVILEGSSGSGKSTLVSILTGLRQPTAGRLLVDGLDFDTLGAKHWRKRIAAAPQFHENHILTGTFAFNLFLGRQTPLDPIAFQEAEAVCQELELGDLLSRMPAGMLQMVGESGWQLSHGERSRLYVARALLQGSEMIVLDESLTALDPENQKRVIECILKRAKTLLVIAYR